MWLDTLVRTLGLDGCDSIPFLIQQAKKLKVSRPSYLATLVVVLSLLLMSLGIMRNFLFRIYTIGFPLYETIQIIENKDFARSKQWLSYWIIFTIVLMIDEYFYWILYYVPYYHFLRLAFLVALFHPELKGAELLYDVVVHKIYIKILNTMYFQD